MERPGSKTQRMIALFVLGVLLFNFPLLALASREGTLFGVPILYAYIFLAWGIFIALIAWLGRSR